MEMEEIGNFHNYTEIAIDVSLERQTKTFNDTVFIQKVLIKAAAIWPGEEVKLLKLPRTPYLEFRPLVRDVEQFSKKCLPKEASEAAEQSLHCNGNRMDVENELFQQMLAQMKQFENDTSCDEFFENNYGKSCIINFTFDHAKENNGKSKVQWKIPLVEEENENKISIINYSSKEPKPILKQSTLPNASINFCKIDNGKFFECKSENFLFPNLNWRPFDNASKYDFTSHSALNFLPQAYLPECTFKAFSVENYANQLLLLRKCLVGVKDFTVN
ncbi:hypothetical protein T4A_4508 [Trichinella pseudospiralis]|uniref:Uncharacterized protein n=1 Tax=Trichinella pseudospiralis TaxID=6337 RepID=A0A0V1EDD9_TRIPS|nr:hypothetical protein T4A_4508 [Trichinella pseudospiralis]